VRPYSHSNLMQCHCSPRGFRCIPHLNTHLALRSSLIFSFILSFTLTSNPVFASSIGNVRQITEQSQKQGLNHPGVNNLSTIEITTDQSNVLQISLLKPDVFRLWAGVKGKFIDAGDKAASMVLQQSYDKVAYTLSHKAEYELLETSAIALRIYKKPLRLALYRADNKTLLWQEQQALELSENRHFKPFRALKMNSFSVAVSKMVSLLFIKATRNFLFRWLGRW